MSTTDRVLGAIFDGLNDNFKQRIQTQRARKNEEYNYRRDLKRRQDNYDDLVAKGYYNTNLNDPNAVALSNGQIKDVYQMTPLQYRAPKEFAPQKLDNAQIADKLYNDMLAKGMPKNDALDIAYNGGRGLAERGKQQRMAMRVSAGRGSNTGNTRGGSRDDLRYKTLEKVYLRNLDNHASAQNNYNGIRAKNVSKTMFIDDPNLTLEERAKGISRKIEVPNPNYDTWLAEQAVAKKALEDALIARTIAEGDLNDHIKRNYPDWNTTGGKLYIPADDRGGAEISIGFEPREYPQNQNISSEFTPYSPVDVSGYNLEFSDPVLNYMNNSQPVASGTAPVYKGRFQDADSLRNELMEIRAERNSRRGNGDRRK